MSYIDLRAVQIQDANNITINPAQDETVILLRRLVQIASTLATQDSAQRQRVAVEAMPTVTVAQGTASSLNATVTGTVTANIGTGSLTNLNQFAGVDIRWNMIDWARTAYNTGIRANLINS